MQTANHRKTWGPIDERILVQKWEAGESIQSIADALGRTTGAISAQLWRRGYHKSDGVAWTPESNINEQTN